MQARLPLFYIGLAVFCFHLGNACLRTTYHDPDEYWQSLEVAHAWVFGYGGVTWEWRHGIRSSLFIWIWIAMFKFLQFTGLDSVLWVMHLAPKIVMGFLVTLSDLAVFSFVRSTLGEKVALSSILASVFSIFNLVYATRSLSNSAEMVCTSLILYLFWPYDPKFFKDQSSWKRYAISALISCGIGCMIRPTNAILWILPWIHILSINCHNRSWVFTWGGIAALVITVILLFQLVLDHILYSGLSITGSWILTPWSFIKLNLFDGLSEHYGVMPWYWYLAFGVPFLLSSWIPFLYLGRRAIRMTWSLVFISGLCGYSSLAHKEFRFIHPILPPLLPAIGYGMSSKYPLKKLVLVVFCFLNFSVALFLNRYHNCGIIPTMDRVSEIIHRSDNPPSFFFLMPCHATPWLSYIHHPRANISMLTCEHPKINPAHRFSLNATVDETTTFYTDPLSHLSLLSLGTYDYIVVFDYLYQEIMSHPSLARSKVIWRHWNALFYPDEHRAGDLVILSMKN